MTPTNEVLVIDNLFDESTVSELKNSVEKHFKDNLLSTDFIDITNSIVDCHGLALSDTAYFPYSERCWNILCLKMKKNVDKYSESLGIDPVSVIPYSCWAERSVNASEEYTRPLKGTIEFDSPLRPNGNYVRDAADIVKDVDGQVRKHFLRSVYNLESYDSSYGTVIQFGNQFKCTKIESKDNRLIIYDGGSYKSAHYYPDVPGKCNIVFDWYINEPYDVPDWILPVT